ncbi:MAG: hypothetical protein FJ363_04850 [Gemmatimonadetes bacterium]|nr:hypothetical protein [Gemmatimonadota bacterium]
MMSSPVRRALRVSVAAFAAAALGACAEQLDAGSACPTLCPGLSVPIVDTTISPVLAFDTTLSGFPSIGTEEGIPLAARGDTLDVRAVLRFDTLLATFTPPNDTARPVTRADSAVLRMRFNLTQSRLPAWVRFELYDVDTIADDLVPAAVLAQFRAGRLVAQRTLTRAEITDSLRFALPSAWLLQKIQSGARVRFGLRLVGASSVSLRLHTLETGLPADLRYYVSPDTAVKQVVAALQSGTPLEPASLAPDFRDYAVVARNALPSAGALAMAAGGVPARRSYLRFNIPSWLLDSATIVRATLELTQMPSRGYDDRDTVTVIGQALAATPRITDLFRASQVLVPPGLFVTDSIRAAPADSGRRTLEVNGLLRVWKSAPDTALTSPQRAIVLVQREEGLHGAELRFFNSRAPASVRPRLRVSYMPRVNFGVP